ncbi:ankyrin repeat domain-containing protein [Wolbachia endosymbiont of Ctenocephalides felis wCfeT]|uniref:ankyrin repeat domain-containing protein n=1 Tax=Wolbachia endosymbiont of Ctenocephalides felis wCfeT TaxID=2732593 RepID=UPI00144687D1|nr:ankyrin repeat domain-containing protein [Wolbachia endosymbiont of Ctenocephalides felis wCfeT]
MELLHKILKTLNHDQNLDSSNIVEKIKLEFEREIKELYLQQDTRKHKYKLCEEEYELWRESEFSLDHQFDTGILLNVAAKCGYFNIVKYLKDRGANIDIQNGRGNSPLHEAVEYRCQEMVKFLLENGASINAKAGVSEETPLCLATQVGDLQIIELLIKEKADIDATNGYGSTSLHKAVLCENINIVRLLIENGADVNFQNKDGDTPLHNAANKGNIGIAELLIENGANTNIKNAQGDTPLHEATWLPRVDIIKLLVAKGAKIDITNNIRQTPLHIAAHRGYEEAILALIELGSDSWIRDNNGATPRPLCI